MASDHLWMWVDTELKRLHIYRLLAACAAMTLVAHSACADGLGDAKAGLEALNRGDNTAAVSLFTKAITGGKLSRADKELAFVKRAEAYLAMGTKDKALADATKALALDASDSEAAAVRDKTQGVANDGPSREVTMKFIQDKLNNEGELHYVSYVHDNADGSDWINIWSDVTSGVIANPDISDPANCRIKYHRKTLRDFDGNQEVVDDRDYAFTLRDVRDIVVETREQELKQGDADSGNPTWDSRVDPPIFVLVVRRRVLKFTDRLRFRDEEMANRVAKALVHAVELCGGGKKDDPF